MSEQWRTSLYLHINNYRINNHKTGRNTYIQGIHITTRQAEHRRLHKLVRSVVIWGKCMYEVRIHTYTYTYVYINVSSLKVVLIWTYRSFSACNRVYFNTAHYVSGTTSVPVFRIASSKTKCARTLGITFQYMRWKKSRKSISSNVTRHRQSPLE
jgi:hypothetical protein